MYFYDIFKNLIMKTKDILLVGGGAIIIYLLWKRSKKSKITEDLAGGSGAIGGSSAGIGLPSGGLDLPIGMGLPNLTAGTGVPTEIAVQEGGVITSPTPALVSSPSLTIEDALSGTIKPIKKSDIVAPILQEPAPIKFPKDLGLSQAVLPSTSEENLNPIVRNEQNLISTPSLNASGSGRIINARLYRGVM